jgi:hypothetical protein
MKVQTVQVTNNDTNHITNVATDASTATLTNETVAA